MRSRTREVKDEILSGKHAGSFEHGLLRGLTDAGAQRLSDGTPAVAVDSTRTARVAHRIAKEVLRADAVVLVRESGARGRRFLLSFPGRAADRLREFSDQPRRRMGAVERRGYLAGIFLAAGTLTPPQSGYLLELRVARPQVASEAMRILHRFGLQAHRRIRREYSVVYLQGADQVAEALSLFGAAQARLALEDARSLRSVRGAVNRLVNAEAANVEKSVRASVSQSALIREFAAREGLESLPEKLLEAAQARLAFPEASLEELGSRLGLTKAGMHYRLSRVLQLARAGKEHEFGRPAD
ncbi:MAG: DNA-binding protein WhiA [Thermaerobacter sp.]|nr:DNA-binding protein WhiA [Thermaerobacter sp.]